MKVLMRRTWTHIKNDGTAVLTKEFQEYLPENDIRKINVEGYNDSDSIIMPVCKIRPNKLQAVIVLLTSYEILSNRFQILARNILKTTKNAKHIYLLLFVNNNNYKNVTYPNKLIRMVRNKGLDHYSKFLNTIQHLKKIFKNVFVHNINIKKEDDIYMLTDRGEFIPKYGLISGPNLLFLGAMNICKRFNTVLLLETDCILKENWLSLCEAYVNNCGTFLISGSTYDGIGEVRLNFTNPTSFFHINGVAFYNTGNSVFQKMIEELDKYLIHYAKTVSPINAYDFVMTHMILENLSSQKNFKFWRYVYRNIIKNTLIVNCSLNIDKNNDTNEIYRLFPSCVILHKKL